ncbi:MAG: hypothetical protein JSS83_28735 [Cyanobacteria bacterium SZAS LIN-3]|nr:hypothetical protein [Cyanobacteria bacterium SZAS LIN-3]MBS2005984.1 hypothetical protein [Cyanobacteria bacterium SZAS TMP-1]
MLEVLEAFLNDQIAQLRHSIDMERARTLVKVSQSLKPSTYEEMAKEATAYVIKLHNYLSLARNELQKAEANRPGLGVCFITLGFNSSGHKMCCEALRQMVKIIEADLESAQNGILARVISQFTCEITRHIPAADSIPTRAIINESIRHDGKMVACVFYHSHTNPSTERDNWVGTLAKIYKTMGYKISLQTENNPDLTGDFDEFFKSTMFVHL